MSNESTAALLAVAVPDLLVPCIKLCTLYQHWLYHVFVLVADVSVLTSAVGLLTLPSTVFDDMYQAT